tara:strand:+ start:555 stop:881 length:327 start_codon:yes stop_codon:yes gene_type:complete
MVISKNTRKEVEKLEKENLTLLGLFSLCIGLPIIIIHNIWEDAYTITVSVFGWLIVLKGFFRILNIKSLNNTRDKIKYKTDKHIIISSCIALFMGLSLIILAIYYKSL